MAAKIKDTWSDKRCIEIAFRDNFHSSVNNINVQWSIISRFLNFYLDGKIQKGQTVTDILFAVLSIMPFCSPDEEIKEETIWNPENYHDEGTLFFLSPDQKLQFDINMITKRSDDQRSNENIDNSNKLENKKNNGELKNGEENDILKYEKDSDKLINSVEKDSNQLDSENNNFNTDKEEPQTNKKNKPDNVVTHDTSYANDKIRWFRLKHSTTNASQLTQQYGPAENAAFCRSCNKLLDNWNNIESRQCLKYFFGVVALVLMRTRIKSFHNISNYFATKFCTICSVSNICYSPPHQTCIKKCWKTFKKIAPNAQTMYAKIVVNSFYIDRVNMARSQTKNIFKIAILSHAANFGMGLMSMLQEIASYTDSSFDLAFEILQIQETKEALSKVKSYIDKFLRNKHENTHHWSRLIEIEQFTYLCCKSNRCLAVIMAAFIEKLRSNYTDIWKSTWIHHQDLKDRLDSLKEIGYTLYEKYNKAIENDLHSQLNLSFNFLSDIEECIGQSTLEQQ